MVIPFFIHCLTPLIIDYDNSEIYSRAKLASSSARVFMLR